MTITRQQLISLMEDTIKKSSHVRLEDMIKRLRNGESFEQPSTNFREHDMSDWTQKRKARAEELAVAMSDFVNDMGHDKVAFIEKMGREHRTLQQSFTGLCFAWLEHLASLEEGQFDGRNEASVKAAKKIFATFDKYDLALPYI